MTSVSAAIIPMREVKYSSPAEIRLKHVRRPHDTLCAACIGARDKLFNFILILLKYLLRKLKHWFASHEFV